jgi:hypothetical protein
MNRRSYRECRCVVELAVVDSTVEDAQLLSSFAPAHLLGACLEGPVAMGSEHLQSLVDHADNHKALPAWLDLAATMKSISSVFTDADATGEVLLRLKPGRDNRLRQEAVFHSLFGRCFVANTRTDADNFLSRIQRGGLLAPSGAPRPTVLCREPATGGHTCIDGLYGVTRLLPLHAPGTPEGLAFRFEVSAGRSRSQYTDFGRSIEKLEGE